MSEHEGGAGLSDDQLDEMRREAEYAIRNEPDARGLGNPLAVRVGQCLLATLNEVDRQRVELAAKEAQIKRQAQAFGEQRGKLYDTMENLGVSQERVRYWASERDREHKDTIFLKAQLAEERDRFAAYRDETQAGIARLQREAADNLALATAAEAREECCVADYARYREEASVAYDSLSQSHAKLYHMHREAMEIVRAVAESFLICEGYYDEDGMKRDDHRDHLHMTHGHPKASTLRMQARALLVAGETAESEKE